MVFGTQIEGQRCCTTWRIILGIHIVIIYILLYILLYIIYYYIYIIIYYYILLYIIIYYSYNKHSGEYPKRIINVVNKDSFLHLLRE